MPDLASDLTALGGQLDYPTGDDLRTNVLRALASGARPRASVRRGRRIAVVALCATAAVSLPAVADLVGLRGVRVDRSPSPPVAGDMLGAPLRLGRPAAVDEVVAVAGFDILPRMLGPADGTWMAEGPLGVTASMVWGAGGVLPPVAGGEFGALLTVVRARAATDVLVSKTAGPDTRITEVEIRGGRGLWIEGAHSVAYRTDAGIVWDEVRLADRVLLWERAGVTLRLETALDRAGAERIARSVG